MLWYERYKSRLKGLFNSALDTIAGFPAPLNELGLAYAKKFDPVDNDGGKDYICTLLPYWLQEPASLTDKQCGQLALANVYGMLYFFIQDDVMDSKVAGDDWKSQLALGNLLQLEMYRVLRELFPSHSPLWDYYNSYVRTWADSVVNEGNGNYFLTNPLRTAGKAGPVKVSVAGAWLLALDASGERGNSSQEDELILKEKIRYTEEAVDTALMTLQMLDDWSDWREDLTDGSYNGLLAMIATKYDSSSSMIARGVTASLAEGSFVERDKATISSDTDELTVGRGEAAISYDTNGLTTERVEAAIYVRGCMQPYAETAVSYHNELLLNPHAPPDLVAFNLHLLDSLRDIANRLAERKRKLLGGGINLLNKRQ